MLIAALGFMSLGALTVSAQAPAKTPETGSISGRVTFGDKAATGVTVVVMSPSSQKTIAEGSTNSEGHYQLTGVPAGRFTVVPIAPAFVPTSENSYQPGKAVTLSAAEAVEGIDLQLTPGGVITGRVIDADNNPVMEERVSLSPVDQAGAPARGFLPMPFHQMYQTDDRGVYRIYGLPAGRYKVSVGQESGGSISTLRSGYYERTYYPNATEEAKASVVDLAEGTEAVNIDIVLARRASSLAVSGRVVDTDSGQPVAGVRIAYGPVPTSSQSGRSSSSPATPTDTQGGFRVEGLKPGRYTIMVTSSYSSPTDSPSTAYSDPVLFEVVDQDLSNLEIKALRGSTLTGNIVPDGITDQNVLARFSTLHLGLHVAPTAGISLPETIFSNVGPGGSVRFSGLRAGKAFFSLATNVNGVSFESFGITRVERNGVVQTQGIEIQPGQDITGVRIFIRYGNGRIHGQINVEGGQLPAGLSVQLLHDGAPTIQRITPVDSRGRFVVEHLAAGTYEVTLVGQIFHPTKGVTPPPPVKQIVNVANDADTEVILTLDLRNQKAGQ
jgi:protocatechuate 3,4-dioxygenase beta subunit